VINEIRDLELILAAGRFFGPVSKNKLDEFCAACAKILVHPFEASLGVRSSLIPDALNYRHLAVADGGWDAPMQPGQKKRLRHKCSFCLTPIRWLHSLQELTTLDAKADMGRHFYVGSDCIGRAEGTNSALYQLAKRSEDAAKKLIKLFATPMPTEEQRAKAKAAYLKQQAAAWAHMNTLLGRARQ